MGRLRHCRAELFGDSALTDGMGVLRDVGQWWLHFVPVLRETSLHLLGRPYPCQRGCPALQNSLSAEMSSQLILHQRD